MAAPALDPLRYGSSASARAGGGLSYSLRYDPWYGAKFYAGLWLLAAALAAAFVFGLQGKPLEPANFLYPGMLAALALLTLLVFPMWKRYDLGSSVNYCRRQLGPGAAPSALRACTERREDVETTGGGNGFLTGLLVGDLVFN
jgi:hypothetical protein